MIDQSKLVPTVKAETRDEKCEIAGCPNRAEYEGYMRRRDGFGFTTGLIHLICVCPEHTSILIAAEDKP